ncbi:MAG: cytosine permease [Candidatus Bathyarchaeia archaeon]
MGEEIKDKYGDYALLEVPEKERRSSLAMFIEWTSVVTCVAAIWGGGALGVGGDAVTTTIAVIIGSIILAILGGLIALIGGYTRMTTYSIMRYPFGRIGASILGLICSGIGGMLWFTMQTWLAGILISSMLPGYWFTNIVVATVWSGILMMITSLYGIAAIIVLSYLLGPMFLLLTYFGAVAAFEAFGGIPALLAYKPATPVSIGALITTVVGYYAIGMVIVSDISRYGRKPSDGGKAWAAHIMLFNTTLVLIGAFSIMLTGSENIALAMLKIGMGYSALAFLFLTQLDTNDNNLWVSSLAWVNAIGGRLTRRHWTAIMGVVGTIWAALVAYGFGPSMQVLFDFGGYLGRLIPQMGTIMIADFFVFRPYVLGLKDATKRYKFGPGSKYSIINVAGIISWIISSVLAFYAEALGVTPAVMGIVSGFILYLVIATICHKAGVKYEVGEWIERPTGF